MLFHFSIFQKNKRSYLCPSICDLCQQPAQMKQLFTGLHGPLQCGQLISQSFSHKGLGEALCAERELANVPAGTVAVKHAGKVPILQELLSKPFRIGAAQGPRILLFLCSVIFKATFCIVGDAIGLESSVPRAPHIQELMESRNVVSELKIFLPFSAKQQ